MKACIDLEPTHRHAYNNLAFIYNMHNYFDYTIDVCNQAEKAFTDEVHRVRKEERKKQGGPSSDSNSSVEIELLDHNCHRHWAYALFKRSEMGKAIK